MKQFLSIGLLTVGALMITERPAQAWMNAKFSVGLNWHVQSANNNFLWGFWKNGQVPGPEAFGHPGGGPAQFGPMMGPSPIMGPAPMMPPASQQFPFFGSNPQGYPPGYPQGFPQGTPPGLPTETAPPPQTAQQQQAYYGGNYAYNPYQTVSYQPSNYYYPNYYYYPASTQGYNYQVPSYWYQGR